MNVQIAQTTVGVADALRRTQTGQLGWNVAGVLIGLLVVALAMTAWG
jgi:hypothetical protein